MQTSARDIVMPKIGLTMTEGKLAEWKVNTGDEIEVGHTLFILETEKVANEVEAESAGVIDAILVQAGETVPVGTTIARMLVTADGKARAESRRTEPSAPPPAPPVKTHLLPGIAVERRPAPIALVRTSRIIATPFARRLARERGVDLSMIHGSGPNGRIKAADVEMQPTRQFQALGGTSATDNAPSAFRFELQLPKANVAQLQDEIQAILPNKVPLAAFVAVAAASAFKDDGSSEVEQLAVSISVRDSEELRRAVLLGVDCLRLRAIAKALAGANSDNATRPPALIFIEDPGLKDVVAFEPSLLASQMVAIGLASSDTMLSLSISVHRDFDFRRACEFIERLTHHLKHPFAMLATL